MCCFGLYHENRGRVKLTHTEAIPYVVFIYYIFLYIFFISHDNTLRVKIRERKTGGSAWSSGLLTNHHECELESLLDRLPVDLIG